MYGLSADYNVSAFNKKELSLLCFSANTIDLTFDCDVSITIIGSFIHNYDKSAIAEKQDIPVTSSSLMCLIGKVVKFAERANDGGLVLHFDNSHILTILDDSREYESYSVCIGGKETFV